MTKMAQLAIIVVIFIIGFAHAHGDGDIKDLKKRFNDDYTQVIQQKYGLETRAKYAFREFLTKNSLVDKSRIESYFTEWRTCVDLDGPFDNDEKQEKALSDVMNPAYFQASLFMEQLLQNRDDSKEAIQDFKKTIISRETRKLQLYYSGDGDIISSVIILSQQNDGECIIINYISD